MRWVYLTTAPNELVAQMWRDLLVDAGIPALVEARGYVSYLGASPVPCRIQVFEGREQEALEVLQEYLTPADAAEEDA